MTEKHLSLAVCDDDPDIRSKLLSWIPSIKIPEHCRISVTEFASGSELLESYRAKKSFDLIFLDMLMPGPGGIETAKLIREKDEKALIIFLTSTPDYAVQAYRVEAFDYLLKTGFTENMEPVFQKAIEVLAGREDRRLQIRSGTSLHSIECGKIEYIEIYSKRLSVHIIPEQTLETYKPIRELESEIQGLAQFCKIHRSIIINLGYITQIDPKFVMTVSGQKLPVARGKYESLKKVFLTYSARTH